jgi:hypothetical protein
VGHTYFIARDSRGRYFANDHFQPSVIVVFDSAGRLTTRFGRSGSGPGEYEHIAAVVIGPGDSLHVVDGRNRHTVLVPDTWEAARVQQLPATLRSIITLQGDRLVANGIVPTEERVGLPLHVVDMGTFVRSFGSSDRTYRRDQYLSMFRETAYAGDGRFWTVPPNRYAIELWDTSGVRHALIGPGPSGDWFESWTEYRGRSLDQRPQPSLTDVVQADDLLIVLAHVPAHNWRNNLETRERPGGTYVAERVRGAAFDTRFDIYDARTLAFLGTATVDEYYLLFISPGQLGQPGETPEGHEYMRTWEFEVRRDAGGGSVL